jgi:hypothetical protein
MNIIGTNVIGGVLLGGIVVLVLNGVFEAAWCVKQFWIERNKQ